MPDAQGNPDTQDIFQHWAVVRNQARALMNAARDMEKMGDDMTPAGKANRMQAMKTVHPNCPVCQAFEGNHPAENPTVEVQPEPEPEPEALPTPGRYAHTRTMRKAGCISTAVLGLRVRPLPCTGHRMPRCIP